MSGNGNGFAGNHLGVNMAYTKFFFVTPGRDDEATRVKLRAAAGTVGRGFFNDFDAEGRDTPPHETIQFLIRADIDGAPSPGAPYALQICSKYRPRLKETEIELQRRVGEFAEVTGLEGAVRVPQYTSAEMHAYAYKAALARGSGRVQKNVIVIPMSKSPEWWDKQALDRQTYFYPHADGAGAACFHDPADELKGLVEGSWPHPWSRVRRQWSAFLSLAGSRIGAMVCLQTEPRHAKTVARLRTHTAGPVGILP